MFNAAHLFTPHGLVFCQKKVHLTPLEKGQLPPLTPHRAGDPKPLWGARAGPGGAAPARRSRGDPDDGAEVFLIDHEPRRTAGASQDDRDRALGVRVIVGPAAEDDDRGVDIAAGALARLAH